MGLDLLTNSARVELAKLHGSHEQALHFRTRKHLALKPENGEGVTERVIIVNDLHMAVGSDNETHKYHPSDEFTAEHERQFAKYLAREWEQAEQKGYTLRLCLNGDIVDILQTAFERPGLRYPDGYTDDGRAPQNTPANVLVQLNIIYEGHRLFFRDLAQHLLRGHSIDYLPGNHDRHLYNEYVWSGQVQVGKRIVKGFTHLLEREMLALGKKPEEIDAALGRLQRKPFAVYGDVWVDHGDNTDEANRVIRPLGELYEPSALHTEMEMALGDYGVRAGFNHLEPLEPRLASSEHTSIGFWGRALRHPIAAWNLIKGFVSAMSKEGYKVSPYDDMMQRIADTRNLVDRYPEIIQAFNKYRSVDRRLSPEQIKDGLEAMERLNATPYFSNFSHKSSLHERVLSSLIQNKDNRTDNEIIQDTLGELNRSLGINTAIHGHTHAARDDVYITPQECAVRHIDTHTWMDRHGDWGRASLTFGEKGRGVGVIELGLTPEGKAFSSVSLSKISSEDGVLVAGDLFAEADENPELSRKRMREIFAESHPRAAKNHIRYGKKFRNGQFKPNRVVA